MKANDLIEFEVIKKYDATIKGYKKSFFLKLFSLIFKDTKHKKRRNKLIGTARPRE